jgi:hypothetical protein
MKVAVHFPKKTYYLCPEKNTTRRDGFIFPSEIDNRTLFLTGNSGVGKTTRMKKICENEHIGYSGQECIIFPNLQEDRIPHKNLSELVSEKFIEGHFTFCGLSNIPLKKHFFPHDRKIVYSRDYPSLEINEDLNLDSLIKEKFIFEFLLPKPSFIKKLRIKRYNQEKKSNHIMHTIYKDQNKKNIKKEEYLLYQTAHKLFEQGADVYIRTSFNGTPLRFLK